MITRNYWLYKEYSDSHPLPWSWTNDSLPDFGIIDSDGNGQPVAWSISENFYDAYTLGSENQRLFVNLTVELGGGTTTPTVNDYMLESSLMTWISDYSQTINMNSDGESVTITMLLNGRNTNVNPITINEIGIYKEFYYSVTAYGGGIRINEAKKKTLFVREILNSPIIVEANDSFVLPFQWVES